MAYNWHSFLWTADEFLIEYSLPPALASVKLFLVGHALELYLKATLSKLTGDPKLAVNYRHKIRELFDACRARDAQFMLGFEIKADILDLVKSGVSSNRMGSEAANHFLRNQELYVIACKQADLKYFGAPPLKNKANCELHSFGFVHPSPYWIVFFKSLRSYLGLPQRDVLDRIAAALESNELPDSSARYLNELYV